MERLGNEMSNKTILLATDFQVHSTNAFECAVQLAASREAKLVVMHVCNMPDSTWGIHKHPTLHEELRGELDKLRSDHVAIERIFCVGDPGPEICKTAGDLSSDMIVMGVTNKCGVDELIGGSVHDFVIQHAPCAVVTLCHQPPPATCDSTAY